MLTKMADAPEVSKEHDIRVTIDPVYPSEGAPIRFINFGKFTHVGSEVFLDWGVLDDQQLVRAKGSPEATIKAYVQGRFGMSAQGFLLMLGNANEIARQMVLSGVIRKETLASIIKE